MGVSILLKFWITLFIIYCNNCYLIRGEKTKNDSGLVSQWNFDGKDPKNSISFGDAELLTEDGVSFIRLNSTMVNLTSSCLEDPAQFSLIISFKMRKFNTTMMLLSVLYPSFRNTSLSLFDLSITNDNLIRANFRRGRMILTASGNVDDPNYANKWQQIILTIKRTYTSLFIISIYLNGKFVARRWSFCGSLCPRDTVENCKFNYRLGWTSNSRTASKFEGDVSSLAIYNFYRLDIPDQTENVCSDAYKDSEKCKEWADEGECENNPSWMLRNCKRACKVCLNDEDKDIIDFNFEQFNLKRKLMEKYDNAIRPVRNFSDPIKVKFIFNPRRLQDLEEVNHLMKVYGYGIMSWIDPRLKWNPDLFGGIDSLVLSTNNIWVPDISVFNSNYKSGSLMLKNMVEKLIVSSNGLVYYVPWGRYVSQCTVDHTFFPYDRQSCQITFGSKNYGQSQMQLEIGNHENHGDFGNHKKWASVQREFKLNSRKYPCCDEPYMDVTYTYTFQRRPSFYIHVAVSPAVVTSFLIPFIFCLEPESRERTTLAVGIILIFTIMVSSLMTVFWSFGSSPLILKYYSGNIVATLIAWTISRCLGYLQVNPPEMPPPSFIVNIITSMLGRLCCIGTKPINKKTEDIEIDEETNKDKPDNIWEGLFQCINRLMFLVFLSFCIAFAIYHVKSPW